LLIGLVLDLLDLEQSKIQQILFNKALDVSHTTEVMIYLRTRQGGFVNVDGLNSGLPGNVTCMIPFIKKMLLRVSGLIGICKLQTANIVSTRFTIKNSNMDIIFKI